MQEVFANGNVSLPTPDTDVSGAIDHAPLEENVDTAIAKGKGSLLQSNAVLKETSEDKTKKTTKVKPICNCHMPTNVSCKYTLPISITNCWKTVCRLYPLGHNYSAVNDN